MAPAPTWFTRHTHTYLLQYFLHVSLAVNISRPQCLSFLLRTLVALLKCCNVIHRHLLEQQSPIIRPITILHDQSAKKVCMCVCLDTKSNSKIKQSRNQHVLLYQSPPKFLEDNNLHSDCTQVPASLLTRVCRLKEDSCLRPSYCTQ